ncbi:hypothetical protein [Glycomyces paridis]|uniref:VTT domain-containing protein n=1 Tax=Glycomyces paridis TaxID=2126555 RepID=A0A4S8PG11_9ACTN|nr:hypothetical protein [Glycomyces paridis]THV27234.1 hypothetical protein E9998_15335 [Glycomyces paridis]
MIAAYLATCLTGLVSAFLPVTPVEPYLVGLVAATGYGALGLGVAAAVGQTAGKTVIFLGARGAFRSERLRAWIAKATRHREKNAVAAGGAAPPDRPVRRRAARVLKPVGAAARRLTVLLDRPALVVPILFLSAMTGLPPLLATSVYIAGTRISTPVFAVVCLAGRSVRFVAIAYAPQLFLD